MKRLPITVIGALSVGVLVAAERSQKKPIVDYGAFLGQAQEIQSYRQTRLVSEETFMELSKFPDTVILDTRSLAKYRQIHVRGAKHLNFSDITERSLARAIPSKDTRILIYCNNNFDGDPVNLESKMAPAALNIPTFITLYTYGYRNVYELQPLLSLDSTSIPFNRKSSGRRSEWHSE